MWKRSVLVAALAAAGIAGSAHAQFASAVFVPELAIADSAICRSPGAGLPLLRLAQATPGKQKEISPAVRSAATSSAPPDDVPLIKGLGSRTIRVTSTSKEAQAYF